MADGIRTDTTAEAHHHGAGAVAGKALGTGLGGLAALAGLFILFGPFLLAPLALVLQTARALDDQSWRWVAAVAVGLGVIAVQLLFAIQRNPLVRTLTVAIFSFIFMAAAWLFLTRPGDELPLGVELQPWWERLTPTGWIVIAVGTLIYSGLYWYLLNRVDRRRWAGRLQLFGARSR
jgi:hypothetical protein